jgi:hypothetical protein
MVWVSVESGGVEEPCGRREYGAVSLLEALDLDDRVGEGRASWGSSAVKEFASVMMA